MYDRLFTDQVTRRGFLRGAAVLGGAALAGDVLAACGGLGTQATTVTSWDWWVSQSPWLDNEVKLFQKAHGNIQIKRTINASATYDKLFTLAERSNNAPDVFMISSPDNGGSVPLNDQVARGWLHPLDKWATRSWRRQFPPYTFVEGTNMFGGKIYSLPLAGPSPWVQLYINNKVFRDAGLVDAQHNVRIPQTWDDVTTFAQTITKKSNGNTYGLGFGNGTVPIFPWWTEVFIRAAGSPGGGDGLDLRSGSYTYGTDRNYQDFVSLLMTWKNKGYMYPNSVSISDEIARAYFERGKFGMTVGGVWNQAEWTQHGFKDYSVTTLVGPYEKRLGYFYSTPGGSLMAMSSKAKHPDEAWEWLNWFYSVDAGKRWVQSYNEDLSIHPQNNDPKQITFAPFKHYVEMQGLSIPGPSAVVRNPANSYVVLPPVQPNFATVMTGIYTGQIKDVRSALSDLAGRQQAALEDGIKKAQQQGHNASIDDYSFPDWNLTKPYKWTIPQYV